MDKLIKQFNTLNSHPHPCDIKGCKNSATTYMDMKGYSIYFAFCNDCKKRLYEELKQEFENEMVD